MFASEKIQKYCKNLFEQVRNILSKLDCKSHLLKYESGIKRTCNIIKKVISKRKARSLFPNKIIVDMEIKDSMLIAEKINFFFADIVPKLASKINQPIFKTYYKYVA